MRACLSLVHVFHVTFDAQNEQVQQFTPMSEQTASKSFRVGFGCNVCGKPNARRCTRCLKEAFCSLECQRVAYPRHILLCETPADQQTREPRTKDTLATANPFVVYMTEHKDRASHMRALSDFDSEHMIWLLLPNRIAVCEAESQALQLEGIPSAAADEMLKIHRERPPHCSTAIVIPATGNWYLSLFAMK